jgi:hypothetical protein
LGLLAGRSACPTRDRRRYGDGALVQGESARAIRLKALIEAGGEQAGFKAGGAEHSRLTRGHAFESHQFLGIDRLIGGNEISAEACDFLDLFDADAVKLVEVKPCLRFERSGPRRHRSAILVESVFAGSEPDSMQPFMMGGAMYFVDELDAIVSLDGIQLPEPGAPYAPCPKVFAEDNQLILSYWGLDEPAYRPTTAALAVVRFRRPYFHMFGPPNEEALTGHPLAESGLYPYGIFRMGKSSLVRSTERMNSVHGYHDPAKIDRMTHYISPSTTRRSSASQSSLEATIEQSRAERGVHSNT